MAGADRRTLVLALLGAGLGVTLLRFPLASATHGAWFLAIAVASLALFGLPLLVGEAALGRFRRRNAVDAFGPGAWKALGGLVALGALALAAVVAVLAGWAGRLVVDSWSDGWFDDPDRHIRLLSAGPDALLAMLLVVGAVTAVAMRSASTGRGSRGLVGALAVASLLLLAGLAAWSNLRSGAGDGRDALFAFDLDVLGWRLAFSAMLAGLLPALLATGVVATLSAGVHDRALPRDAGLAVVYIALGIGTAVLFLAGLAGAHGTTLAGAGGLEAFTELPALLVADGDWEGGLAVGLFFTALLLAALVALLALLEVPATWLRESFPSWTQPRALLGAGLAAALVAVPLCFGADLVQHAGETVAWVMAPLAGLLVATHVGWARPEVLDGFRVGDARHPLDRVLLPVLRYAIPPVMALLLVAGTLGLLRSVGWADGSGGLWALAP